MGDARYQPYYDQIKRSDAPVSEMRSMSDEGIVSALAAAARDRDPYLANVLASEAMNRIHRATTALRHLGEGVIATDAKGRIIQANPVAADLLSRSPREIVGADLHEVFHPESAHDSKDCPLLQGVVGEGPRRIEERVSRRDGTHFEGSITRTSIMRDGDLDGFAVVFQDITEARMAHQRLSEQAVVLEHTVRNALAELRERKRLEADLRLSEERYRRLVEQNPLGIALVAPDNKLIEVNDAMCRITGYATHELVGRSFADITHPDDLAADLEQASRLFRGEITSYRMRKRYVKKDGSVVWVDLIGSLVRDKGGHPAYALGLVEDVTERRQQEEMRSLTAAVVDSTADAIITTDVNKRVLSWNRAAERMFGYTAAEMVGQPIARIFPRETADSEESVLALACTGRSVQNREAERVHKDGSRLHVSLTASPIQDDTGRIVGASSVEHDVTLRRRQEEALRQSEKRLHEAQRLARTGSWLWDLETGRFDWSAELSNVLGGAPERSPASLDDYLLRVHPDDREAARRAFGDLARRGQPQRLDHRILHPDGRLRWVDVRVKPSKAGDARRFVGTTTDVTEVKMAEAKFAALLDAAPDAIVIVDGDGRIALVNRETERMFGYARRDLVGVPVETLVPHDAREHHRAHRGRYVEHPHTRPMGSGLDLYGIRKDGTSFPVEISLSPLRTEQGLFVTAAVRDVTARRQQEKLLAERTEELARSNADLEQFASIASHDLQEPLHLVAGYLRLLQQRSGGRLDRRGHDYLHEALEGTVRMQEMVSALLEYARVKTRAEPPRPTDSAEALDAALANLAQAIRLKHARVEVAGPLPRVLADPAQLTQLFQNIVGNAVKFGGDGGKVQVWVEAEGDWWTFAVRDHGIGIPPEEIPNLFEPFRRASNAGGIPGNGIGLATCKRIVERHGGRIWAESGRGATILRFRLPALRESAHAGSVES